MEIENRKNARRIKLVFFAIPFIFVLTLAPLFMFEVEAGYEIIVGFVIFIALLYLSLNLLGYNYLKLKIDKNSLVIKYFGLAPLNKEAKAFKISSEEVYDYKIEPKLFGLKKMLIVYRMDRGEVFKFPAVNLNALNKKDYANFENALKLLVKINQKLT
ncbi:MAG: hypothetical protein C0599_08750 [Salinivirgaceae bacterium]|nr:MAG: hypothetical protein C0599_08750 [Salinivirgaceae bacterium]